MLILSNVMLVSPLGQMPSGAREKIPPHLVEVRIPSALPKQCVRVCSVDCYRQIKKKKNVMLVLSNFLYILI